MAYALVRAASRLVSTLVFGIASKASVELRLDAARTSTYATLAFVIGLLAVGACHRIWIRLRVHIAMKTPKILLNQDR